jgi:predicted DNA-binding antitoxin AbrB/MazE fold protein
MKQARSAVRLLPGGDGSPAALFRRWDCGRSKRGFFAAAPALYYSGRAASSSGVEIMAFTIEAIYENGVLKPTQPLALQEHEKVRITIEPDLSWAERTAGMLPWTGDPEVLRRIAEDDEFSILESP